VVLDKATFDELMIDEVKGPKVCEQLHSKERYTGVVAVCIPPVKINVVQSSYRQQNCHPNTLSDSPVHLWAINPTKLSACASICDFHNIW
jgi:hypothetical protein